MRILWALPVLLPALVHAELRSPTGGPRSEPIAALIFAVFLLLLALRRGEDRAAGHLSQRLPSFLGVFGALLLSALVPSPVREASWAVALSFALAVLRLRTASWLCVGAIAGLMAALVHWLSPIVLVRWELEGPLAGSCQVVFAALGLGAQATERGLGFVRDGVSTLELGTGATLVGAREALALLAGALTALAVGRSSGVTLRDVGTFALVLTGGTVVHLAVNAIVLFETRSPGLLADPWLRSLALGVPMMWALTLVGSRPRAPAEPAAADSGDVALAPLLAATCGTSLLVLAAFWPGVLGRSSGRIAIDEGHSHWERLDVPFDRDTFGTLSVYNYTEWVRGLERRYESVERIRGRIDDDVLAGIDVLILKTPTSPYLTSEVEALHRFVDGGGGVYLVGDHNDVFGMNGILNSFSARYGMEYRRDALSEIDYKGGQVIDPRVYPPHPLTRAMKPMHYMTSCSIAVSGGARPIMWMNSGYADDPDFGKHNFIGDGKLVGAEPLAPFAQLVSATSGRGKVLAFTDSTLFSSFSIYFPGVRELSFAGVEWLLLSERFPLWRPLAIGFGAVLVAFGAWVLRRRGTSWAAGVIAGVACGGLAADLGCREALAPWALQLEGEEFLFDTTISAGTLPIWHESHDSLPDNFWGLFLAFQRSGESMRVALDQDELFLGKAAIVVWPKVPVAQALVGRAKDFVARGGVLYVFEDRLAAGSATNRLLEPFGLRAVQPEVGRRVPTAGRSGNAPTTLLLGSSVVVLGGEPVALDAEGDPLVARAAYGKGWVVAAGLAEDFSGASMASASEFRGTRGLDLLRLLYSTIDAGDGGNGGPTVSFP